MGQIESCGFCGAEASSHPMVGIGTDVGGDSVMRVYPCCDRCWADPSHRRVRRKVHFYQRSEAAVALAIAGSRTIG